MTMLLIGYCVPQIVYVTRNPRDACVSYYNHWRVLEGYRLVLHLRSCPEMTSSGLTKQAKLSPPPPIINRHNFANTSLPPPNDVW